MNDCVYTAFADYLAHLGRVARLEDQDIFRSMKTLLHGSANAPLYGGAVPAVLGILAGRYDMEPLVEVSVNGLAHIEASAENSMQRGLWQQANYIITDGIDTAPAIYLPLATQHAYFADHLPAEPISMAIGLVPVPSVWFVEKLDRMFEVPVPLSIQ